MTVNPDVQYKNSPEPFLGAHLSISGGLHNALIEAGALSCKAVQVFTKNASTWREKYLSEEQIAAFEEARDRCGIKAIAAHTAYLINLASSRKDIRKKSIAALEQELIRCDQLAIPYLVMHPGSHMGDGVTTGTQRIVDAVNGIFERLKIPTRLLFETMSGQGNSIGHRFEHLADIISRISDKKRVGICLDTCHIFAAGYDIATAAGYENTMEQLHRTVGLENLHVIHINDSRKECGSRVDRHAHIGDGRIGLEGFSLLLNDNRLGHIPKILETPKEKNGKNADRLNLKTLRSLHKRIA